MIEVHNADLRNGYKVRTQVEPKLVAFFVEKNDDRITQVSVSIPLKRDQWQTEWSPHRNDPEYAEVRVHARYNTYSGNDTIALGEAAEIAGEFANRLNDLYAEPLAWQEYECRQVKEVEEAEEAKLQEHRLNLKENLQWYTGQKFKLKRAGYKATVFGVIKEIDDRRISTVSERGVPMTTMLDDLLELSIMYEGERRYTKVYER